MAEADPEAIAEAPSDADELLIALVSDDALLALDDDVELFEDPQAARKASDPVPIMLSATRRLKTEDIRFFLYQ